MAPTYEKRIVCLANSRKTTGRCIAGKVLTTGSKKWIRPVSSRQNGELSEEDRRYQDGTDPKLLDIVVIPMKEAAPHGCQTENHVIDDDVYWTKDGTFDANQLQTILDDVPSALWNNDAGSTINGINDKVLEQTAAQLDSSLKLIEVSDLQIDVGSEGGVFAPAKRKVRGRFSLNGHQYKLSVTDPVAERKYLNGADGSFPVGKAILCVSLSEPFAGHCYKLIAAIF